MNPLDNKRKYRGSLAAIMSGTGPRENVFATRMALTNTKLRLKGAQTGHSLLAKKRDALTTRFRAILKKVDEVRPAFLSCPRSLPFACVRVRC